MAHTIQREIVRDVVCSPLYGIISDGTTYVTGEEQFAICVRWADRALNVHENYIGLYNAPDSRADRLYMAIKDMILRLGLDFHNNLYGSELNYCDSSILPQ